MSLRDFLEDGENLPEDVCDDPKDVVREIPPGDAAASGREARDVNDDPRIGASEAFMALDLEFALEWLKARVAEDRTLSLTIDAAVEAGCVYGLLKAKSQLGSDVLGNRERLAHLAKVRKPASRNAEVDALIRRMGRQYLALGYYESHEITGLVVKDLKRKGKDRSESAVRRALQAHGIVPRRSDKKKNRRI
jgi:hypothetical protein